MGVSSGVSKKCFEVDGGVSKWMVTNECFGQECFGNSQKWMVVWMVVNSVFRNGVSRSGWW